jgi:c-di-GMP-binding flagellar brake protein YcgR
MEPTAMNETQPPERQGPAVGQADALLKPEDYSQYLLHSENEILFILRSLLARAARITVYFNQGKDFLLTAVVAVAEDGLVLDYGSNMDMNRRAEAAEKLLCVTNLDRVRIQFELRGVKQIDFAGRPAFAAALPDTLLRLQRREYYRLTTPIARPPKCRIPLARADGTKATVDAIVVDISAGGLAVVVPPEGVAFEPGMEFPGCRVELPEVGILVATLVVKNRFEVTLPSGARVTRSGCQFADLPGSMLILVQRYIIKAERERKARESGLA